MYAGGQGQNKKLSSVRNMKKMESYSAKTDAALGRNNQLVGQTDQVEILYNSNSGFEWSQTGVSQPWLVIAKKKISILLGCVMRIRVCKTRQGILLCLRVVKLVLNAACEK